MFHKASKSGSTHEPWGCMEQISWSEQAIEYFDQACLSLREQEDVDCKRCREENGSAGAIFEDFEDQPMGLRLLWCVL